MWEFQDVSVSSFSVTVTEAPDTPDRFNDGLLISGEAEPHTTLAIFIIMASYNAEDR